MISHYYYNAQLKRFIVGFANIFTGLKVRTGSDACGPGDIAEIDVPIVYGSKDRVVAAIAASNTQNRQYSLPMMACYMTGLEMAPDRMKGVNQTDRRTYLQQGDVFPTDVKVLERVMPVPYNMQMELSIHASNTDQMFQINEQILILFDYDMQVQFNDAPFDWTRLSSVFLLSLANEENYPVGTERRQIIWTYSFNLPVWLSPPASVRRDLIRAISIRLGDLSDLHLDELDAEGNLAPFTQPFSTTIITGAQTVEEVDPTSSS